MDRGSLPPWRQGNRALSGSNWAAVRHCFNRRDHEWLSLGSGGKILFSNHSRSFSATSAHFRPLPPIFAIWCPDRIAVSGDLKIGTAFNTAFRLEIRHEAWQEPSVIKTRLPWPWRCERRRSGKGRTPLHPSRQDLWERPGEDAPPHRAPGL